MNIKNIFRLKAASVMPVETVETYSSTDAIKEDETYVSYGKRMCGVVNGTIVALTPLLQKVFLYERIRQQKSEELQATRRNELRNKLGDLQSDLGVNLIEQKAVRTQQEDIEKNNIALQNKLVEAKSNIGEDNKMARIKMWIGLSILVIMTVYLFIFYSSTFFSAFFKNFDFDSDNLLSQAMFDPKALPMALHDGVGSLIFIICAPIIFMGLGYLLHFYSVEKGKAKYLKIGVTVIITFVFDCILAYLIAKKIYDIDILMKPGEFPEFSFAIALKDVNVWAVIFCGFITYMIWGFVFDLTMSAYEEFKTNKKEILKIENEITNNRELKQQNDEKLTKLEKDKVSLESSIKDIESKLSLNVCFYDVIALRTAMTDFFAGWITVISALGQSSEAQRECKEVFDGVVSQLIK